MQTASQADRNMIELEVTETVFLTEENIQKVKREIRAIHDCGFRCALDDFGVGFSSLTLLKEFNIDSLKMDRSFFSDLDNAKTRNVISRILELAEQLDMETVAEGIETEEQIDSLRRLGCDVVQGYYFPDRFRRSSLKDGFRNLRRFMSGRTEIDKRRKNSEICISGSIYTGKRWKI